jgi:hypothetical protein
MKTVKSIKIIFLVGIFVFSCQKDNMEPIHEEIKSDQAIQMPEIPDDIAKMMSEEDVAKFLAGPGEEYLQLPGFNEARRRHGRWHPVLMKLGYHLQFGPFVGESCDNPIPCYSPTGPTGAPGCEDPTKQLGMMGMTFSDGYWFSKEVHSEYFPVFCNPDYAGYGQGFYQLDNGLLWLEAENGPFQVDEEGNVTFARRGNYVPVQSTGVFEGAKGWEIMISYTAVENSPSIDPEGKGYSDVIIFGWVYY